MEDVLRLSLKKIQEEDLHNLVGSLSTEYEKRESFLNQLAFILNKNLESNGRNQNKEFK